MSVAPNDIKEKFLKKNPSATPDVNDNEVKPDKSVLNKFYEKNPDLKKKDNSENSATGSKDVPAGAAIGTTSTTPSLKWEDNPLNPAKAAIDYEAKRDKTPEILFKPEDQQKLNSLLTKHSVSPTAPVIEKPSGLMPGSMYITPKVKTPMEVDYDNTVNVENTLKSQLEAYRIARQGQRGGKKTAQEIEAENDLREVQTLKKKAWNELAVNGDKEVEVLSRQDDSGNSFKRTMQDMWGSKPGAWQTEKAAIENKMAKLPKQFLTGMNILKGTEPAMYERVSDEIAKGLPISQSQIAQITNLGLNLEQAKLERDILKSPVTPQEREQVTNVSKSLSEIKTDIDKYEGLLKSKQQLTPDQVQDYKTKVQQYNSTVKQFKPLLDKVNFVDGEFSKRAKDIQETRMKNLVDNPEVFRSFISNGVAEKLDEIGKKVKKSPDPVSDFMTGHTWNYSPEQIKWASEQYLKENGIDPNTPQAQSAIKYLQDNEGVMIGENSIAKAGGIREFGAGLIEPIEGISKTIDDLTRSSNDVYAESQSQGNVQVARKRLESEDTGIRSVVNDVLKGTGQFATQAAIMAATSGGVGAVAKAALGRSGVAALAGDIALADMAATDIAASALLKIKNPVSVFTTSYAMSYDGNLKAALSYTSDNVLAKRAAAFNASMEGATELFLSPLEIAEGIFHKFSKNQTKDLLKILSDKSLKNDPSALKEYVGKFVKGVAGTAKVAGAEIGEEMVTQISDYVTNMYLNPDADSFKNRDLKKELMTTAYQTGLSMAVPALLNGIGAGKANSFSKGSLMVAAQNRQAMVDDLNKSVAKGAISQQFADQQIQLINTAAVANSQVPKKANGADLNTNEKANYIWSRTTEAYMEKQMASTTDAAAKEIWKDKILKQQEYRKGILGLTEEQPDVPEYIIDDKPVSREELLAAMKEKPDGNYFVANDEEVQEALRKIGGIDDKTDSEVTSAVITIGGKTYEGKNHAEAILKAKADGKDISQVDRKRDGKFKLSDGTIIDRAEAKKQFGADRAEQLIKQDEAADNANKEYRKSDKDLVADVEEKGIKNYEKTNIKELKEQALQAPASLKNQFDDEELVVDLIAKNTPEQIEDAIKYQQERIDKDPNMDEVSMTGIDQHIQLLEKGLEKNKQFAELEEKAAELEKEGKPLSKLENLKAKKKLAEVEVPGETVDEKLKYIADKPEGFTSELVALAEKRFPKEAAETKTVSSVTPTEQSGKDVIPLTKEAEDLLASIGEGSKPTFITKNLERIAKDNGIEVTGKMSADDVINALKEKQQSGKEAPPQYTEAETPPKKESSGVSGSALKDVEIAAKKIVGESAFEKLKKEGYTIEKGKFDSDAYASFFGLHTGVQANEFANAGLRLVKPSEKIKVYRGKGKNVGEGENEGITWVAEDKKVAENYSGDGSVEEFEVSKPKNPFPNPTDTIHVKGSDVGNKLKGILNRLFREGKVTKEQAIEASKAIDEFVLAAGEESELYSTKTNKKGVSSKYVKALQALGFDGIVQKESYNSGSPFTATKTGNETNTYGIFKAPTQYTEAATAKEEVEGVSGSALKDAEVNVSKIADEYLYHGTGEGAFRRIREEGLVPQGDKYLYFADIEQYAKTYAQRKGNSFGDRILRVKKSDAYLPDENTTGGDFKIKNKINPNDIEIKQNGKWVKIQEFSDENIGIMPIPKAPTQYTEAATPKEQSLSTPKSKPVDEGVVEGIKYAKREDGTLKNKNEYTPEEWKEYTDSVIEQKLKSEQSLSTKPEIKNEEAKPVKKVSAIQKIKEKREKLNNSKNKNDATKIGEQSKSDKQQRKGTAKQQQGKQADRPDKEENDTGGEKKTGNRNISQQGREEKIAELEKEKQQKINEVTKPDVDFYMGIDNVDLANTTAQNRHELLDIKARLQSLNQIIKCLWA